VLVVSIAFDWVLAAAVALEGVVLQVGEGRSRGGSSVFAGVQRSVLTVVLTFVEVTSASSAFGGRLPRSDRSALANEMAVGQMFAEGVARLGRVAADGTLMVKAVMDAHVHFQVVRVR